MPAEVHMIPFLQMLRTVGRKGDAYDKSLIVFVMMFATCAYDDGLTQGELDSLLLCLGGILATFISGNAAEHGLKKTPPAAPPLEPPAA